MCFLLYLMALCGLPALPLLLLWLLPRGICVSVSCKVRFCVFPASYRPMIINNLKFNFSKIAHPIGLLVVKQVKWICSQVLWREWMAAYMAKIEFGKLNFWKKSHLDPSLFGKPGHYLDPTQFKCTSSTLQFNALLICKINNATGMFQWARSPSRLVFIHSVSHLARIKQTC